MNRLSCYSISIRSSSRRRIELYSPDLAHYVHFELERSIRIPTEIVDHIIAFILSSSSHSFASIAAVSLASSRLRQISLRLFFSTIKARSRTRWFKLWDILASMNRNGVRGVSPYIWVRRVMITTRSLLPASSCLCAFTNLQSLSVDFTEEDSETQETRLKSIFRPRQLLALTLLTSLTFTTLAIIDTYLLNQIADNFPLLQILKVSCTERLNFESFGNFIEGVDTTSHSPIPGTYATASELARQFADALQPLTNLKHLHLGVFLSSTQLLNRHMNHFNDSDYRVEKSKRGRDSHSCPMCGAMHNITLYGPGECKLCLEHAETVRQDEIDASLILAQVLKNVESVGWSSFFANMRKSRKKRVLNQVDLERKMTVWIVRTEGGVVRTSTGRVVV